MDQLFGIKRSNPPQIKLKVPCSVVQLLVTDTRDAAAKPAGAPGAAAAPPPQPPSILQAFARDLGSSTAARFAPLATAPVSCAAGAHHTVATEVRVALA
jgi:hypothetical protein